jgi:hypothetical protein
MDTRKLFSFDIILGTCIGKFEIGQRSIFFSVKPNESHSFVSEHAVLAHWNKMEQLEKQIPIWPSIQEQHRHYSKIETEHDLAYIAKTFTHTTRPSVILEVPMQGNFVTKRFGFLRPTMYIVSDVN